MLKSIANKISVFFKRTSLKIQIGNAEHEVNDLQRNMRYALQFETEDNKVATDKVIGKYYKEQCKVKKQIKALQWDLALLD